LAQSRYKPRTIGFCGLFLHFFHKLRFLRVSLRLSSASLVLFRFIQIILYILSICK